MIIEKAARPRASNAPPSKWLAATELPRAVADAGLFAAALPTLLAFAPRGDGHPVLVLPGFLAGDASTAPLRRTLNALGYDARGWGLGANIGPRSVGSDGQLLVDLIEDIFMSTGRKPSLVGWSLGGVLARIAAVGAPERVRQVITLGSPFAGSPKSTNAWRLYEKVSGAPIGGTQQDAMMADAKGPSPVPSSAIYSRDDGICAWRSCRSPRSRRAENIEVHGSHCGLGVNTSVLYAVADRLAQAEGEWSPFRPRGLAAWMFPSATHA